MSEYRISAELLERAIEAAKWNRSERYEVDEPTEETELLIADLEALKTQKLCRRCNGSVQMFDSDCDWCPMCHVYWSAGANNAREE